MTIEQLPYLGDVYEFVKQRCESFIGKLIIISGNFLQIQRNQLEMLYHEYRYQFELFNLLPIPFVCLAPMLSIFWTWIIYHNNNNARYIILITI